MREDYIVARLIKPHYSNVSLKDLMPIYGNDVEPEPEQLYEMLSAKICSSGDVVKGNRKTISFN